jgi:hypothetical protein
MTDEKSREGWAPDVPDAATLAEVVDRAFDYRGDVTVVLDDGRELVGYLFNRNRDAAEPFVQMFERESTGASSIPYARIRAIRFSGKDTAAGNSYAAWLRSREAAKAASSSPGA